MLHAAGTRAIGTLMVSPEVPGAILHASVTHGCATNAMTPHARGRLGMFVFARAADHIAGHADRPLLVTPSLVGTTTRAHHYPDELGGGLDQAGEPDASTDDGSHVLTATSRAGLSAARRDPPRPRSTPARLRPAPGTDCSHRRSR